MKIFRTIVITLLALGAATACSSGDDTADAKNAAAPAASAAAPQASASTAVDPSLVAATSAYLTALGKVDKKLVADEQVALDSGQQVCVDVEERRTDAEQIKTIAYRFEVNNATAAKILEVTKKNLCLS
jgi:uncharacterized protein YdeI (BOF family)